MWYLICSGVPPDVALVMAQAASFLVRNSAFWRISINTGKIFASMTAWERIWGMRKKVISRGESKSSLQVSEDLDIFPFLVLLLCSYQIGDRLQGTWLPLQIILGQQHTLTPISKGEQILSSGSKHPITAHVPMPSHCPPTPPACFTCIWALLPAVIFEMVQQASFRIDSLGLLSKWSRQGRAEQLRIT